MAPLVPRGIHSPAHRAWLMSEATRLVDFSRAARHPEGGFAWLDTTGEALFDRPVEMWVTARMTHVMALGHLLGRPDCLDLVDHGIASLCGVLADPVNGGWYAAVGQRGDGEKRAYEHAFVVLAASSAVVVDRPLSRALLNDALNVMETRFWDDARGVVTDVWSRSWAEREPYGGANANMHTVEAFLAAADVSGDAAWAERALRIATFFIDGHARAQQWRIPEHFDANWQWTPDYNRESAADQFRPFGATIGHGFEWARLCLHIHAALGGPSAAWLVDAAVGLFDRAVVDGWTGDGFVYTTDWSGRPVVEDRLHWVVCEAIAAAAALHQHTGEPRFEDRYFEYWDLAERFFIDRQHGSWHAQLNGQNQPASTVWSGKPDTYHAVQASLLPTVGLTPSLATALASVQPK